MIGWRGLRNLSLAKKGRGRRCERGFHGGMGRGMGVMEGVGKGSGGGRVPVVLYNVASLCVLGLVCGYRRALYS